MKTKLFLFLFLFSSFFIFAQHKFLDIPKFNEADLKKEKSTIQEEAPAEVLYSSVHNVIDMYTGEMEITVFKRIKIYNKDKASAYLDVEIPIYQNNVGDKEVISGVKAITYNLENGKVISTVVNRDSKFKSKENKNVTIQKFAFENVKNGSVIEYKYQKNTPFIQELPKVFFELDIPVVYEEYVLDAPKPYGFNLNFQGSLMPTHKEIQEKMLYGVESNTWRLGFENIKQYKPEDYVKNSNNFKSSIRPEINSTYFNNIFKSYALTWNDVNKKLKEYDDFGMQLSKKSVGRDLLTPEMTGTQTSLKKAEEILKFIQKNYTWDETYGIFTRDGVKNLVSTKIGNAAEINFLMILMMREAGLKANPIILKTVREGVLNVAYPSITDPNYVIAGLELDNSIYLFDGTSKLSETNLLPPRAYNYNGVLLKGDEAVILNINNTTLSQTFLNVEAKLNHLKLEKELAEFVMKESAYLLNFGYQGMVSIIDALVTRHDVIVYDADSHACIIDGVRLHMGKSFTYRHNDMVSVEKNLERATKVAEENGGGILLITEGVFGMRGQQGKLKEITELKKKYNFRLLVDDAHGFGTLGKTGAGAGEEQGCQDEIDVYFSTFAKSMAGFGAFVAGNKEIIRYLKFNLRSQIFAKSLTMPMVIGGLKRLELLRSRPEIKAKLWENVNKLQTGLKNLGYNLGDTNTCVTPVFIQGSPVEATLLVKDLRENYGIFTSVVVYPVIPKGNILLRLIPTASHTDAEINETLEAFAALKDKLSSGYYKEQEEKMLKEQGLEFKPL